MASWYLENCIPIHGHIPAALAKAEAQVAAAQ